MPVNSRPVLVLSLILITLCFGSCTNSPYSPEVNSVLEAAGDNRAELEKVLEHYRLDEDTLKYMAAEFLIGNMEGHCFVTYMLHDTTGSEIDFNVMDYPDYDSLVAACSIIEDERGEIDYKRKDKIDDVTTITADFLIEQIDYAFKAWREKPWASGLTYDDFRKYILPYRGSNEPLEQWRPVFWDKYAGIEKDLEDPSDPIAAARVINADIMTWFTFDPRFYYHPTDQGMAEMFDNGLGRCEDMTNLTIYAFRANGLAVTSDYTPYWANSGNNHAWNSILGADGKVIPFMGAEANPGEYSLWNKVGKVYRKMFGQQKDNLVFQDNKQEKVPRWLAGKSYLDVTADYVDVADITVKFDREVPDSVTFAYLCVFNSGEWKPIHWAEVTDDGKATFTDMATGIAYLPALYLNEEVAPWGHPFIGADSPDQIALVSPDPPAQSVKLLATTKRVQAVSTDGVDQVRLTSGKEYELHYWNDGWQSLGKAVAGGKPLEFDNVPSGGLYWLVEEDSDREERIFTIEDGSQIWW